MLHQNDYVLPSHEWLLVIEASDCFVVILNEVLPLFDGNFRAGALVLWLWEETHVPKVVSLNPSTVYWMDIFSHLFVVKIVMCV